MIKKIDMKVYIWPKVSYLFGGVAIAVASSKEEAVKQVVYNHIKGNEEFDQEPEELEALFSELSLSEPKVVDANAGFGFAEYGSI